MEKKNHKFGFDVMVRKEPYRGLSGGDGYETISEGFDGGSSNGVSYENIFRGFNNRSDDKFAFPDYSVFNVFFSTAMILSLPMKLLLSFPTLMRNTSFCSGNLSSSISSSLNRLSLIFFLQRFERIEDFLKKFFVSKLCSFNLLTNKSSIIGTFFINLWPFFVKEIIDFEIDKFEIVGVIVWWPWMFMIEEYA